MKLSKITRKQVEQVLKENPIHEVLNISETALTPKQLKYCENLAKGDSKAGAYRKAYNSKAKPSVQANEGYKLSKRPDIDTMTEAIKKGLEWERSYSLAQTRALVVERLTKEALDEDSSPSARINALKALGTVAGVDAFIHRTETTVIKDSESARSELMEKLKQALSDSARTIDQEEDEIDLLNQISGRPVPIDNDDTPDPLHPDPPHVADAESHLIHSNPDKRSQSNQQLPEQVSETTVDEEGEGVSKSHPDWEELHTEKATPSGFKAKG